MRQRSPVRFCRQIGTNFLFFQLSFQIRQRKRSEISFASTTSFDFGAQTEALLFRGEPQLHLQLTIYSLRVHGELNLPIQCILAY